MDPEHQDIQKKKKKSGGFQSMNLHAPVFKAIMGKGYNVPTPVQRKAIPYILEGRDVVVCSRTGSGKTAAFIIPMVHKLKQHSKIVGTRCVIVSPTRELALQTNSVLKQFIKHTDLVVSLIIGGHGFEGQFESLACNPDIVIATPGRLMQHFNETGLTLSKVEMLIFDEADFLFEMGFRDQLNVILKKVGDHRQTLLFSATIPEELSNFARVGLKDYIFVRLDNEHYLSEKIELHFLISKTQEKFTNLLYVLKNIVKSEESVIIFCSTKYHVDFLTEALEKFDIKSVGIYGKMSLLQRRDNFYEFKSGRVKILAVTDLASRGLDVPSVNYVIQYDFPTKPKIFIHRSGRTARAGLSGKTISILATNETMYAIDLLLYIGRKLTNENDFTDYADKAFYGQIPFELLNQYQESFLKQLQDPEIFKAYDTAEKAFTQFIKTRPSASKSSSQQSKSTDFNVVFPLCQDLVKGSSDQIKMIKDIDNFKPRESYLDLKNSGKLKSAEKNETFLENLTKMKKVIEKQEKKKKEEEKFEALFVTEGEAKRSNFIQNFNKVGEKRKRSQMDDFKDPRFFVSDQPKVGKAQNAFNEDGKINSDDINAHVIAEDYEDLLKNRKNFVWDGKKKRFVRGVLNEKGSVAKEKQGGDKNSKFSGKKVYEKWAKNNQFKRQKDGEQEDSNMIDRAKGLFKSKGKYGVKIPGVKTELKNAQQIMKSKKIKKNLKLKNMEKGRRTKIESNMRQKKKAAQGGSGQSKAMTKMTAKRGGGNSKRAGGSGKRR